MPIEAIRLSNRGQFEGSAPFCVGLPDAQNEIFLGQARAMEGASVMFAKMVSFPRSEPCPRILKAVYPGDEPDL
jgi:hypothetical protein